LPLGCYRYLSVAHYTSNISIVLKKDIIECKILVLPLSNRPELDDPNYPYPMSYNTYQYDSGALLRVGLAYATSSIE
jgi:hypothetical protein